MSRAILSVLLVFISSAVFLVLLYMAGFLPHAIIFAALFVLIASIGDLRREPYDPVALQWAIGSGAVIVIVTWGWL